MALTPGTTLGVYEVLSAIGAGGMGEVYQARDTKLDRDVALKVRPEAFTADPDLKHRFEREAKALSEWWMRQVASMGVHATRIDRIRSALGLGQCAAPGR